MNDPTIVVAIAGSQPAVNELVGKIDPTFPIKKYDGCSLCQSWFEGWIVMKLSDNGIVVVSLDPK